MKAIQLFLLSCLSLFCLNACETTEKIDDFPLRPSQLVVNCQFTAHSTWEFQVSKSLSVLDNADLRFINNATIKLFKDSELIETLTEQDPDGWYRSVNSLPEMGRVYSIEVSSPDFENTLFAKEITPQEVPLSNITAVISDSTFYESNRNGNYYYGGNVEGNFNILFKDPPGIDNYYQLSIYYFDTVYQQPDSLDYVIRKMELAISSDDPAVENGENFVTKLLFTDYVFDGQDYQLKIDFSEWRPRKGRLYNFELLALNRSGYLYRKTITAYNNARNDPFAEPVKVFSNIENGYGIFSGYSSVIYPASFW